MRLAQRFRLRKIVRFLAACAADVLIPDIIDIPFKICWNIYRYFWTLDLKDRLEIFQEEESVSTADQDELVEAFLAQWRENLPEGVNLPDNMTEALRQWLVALRQARVAHQQGRDPAEAIRQSLNKSLLAGKKQLAPADLSPQQRQVGRMLVTSKLAGLDKPNLAPAVDLPAVPGYRMLRALGSGGFGVVYLARHDATGEVRAVKVGPLHDPSRFRKEITLAARLNSSHLVRYFEHGEFDGKFWIAMEYLGDCTLADLMRQPGFRDRPDQILLLAGQMLQGLAELHAAGVIHRDLKPANVMMDDQFRLKLIDFGLAKPIEKLDGHSSTATGALLGTPVYMSPEQLDARKDLTAASDVYAFGTVLYEMFVGAPPHQANSLAQLILRVFKEPVAADHQAIPPELRPFLSCCLQMEADRRHQDGQTALASFREVANQIVRRMRHERYRKSWLPILEGQMLEQFAAEHRGLLPNNAVALFIERVRAAGLQTVDRVRLGEILPAIFAVQSMVDLAEESYAEAKQRMAKQLIGLFGEELAARTAEIQKLEKAVEDKRENVTAEVHRQLADEVKTWHQIRNEERERKAADEMRVAEWVEQVRRDEQAQVELEELESQRREELMQERTELTKRHFQILAYLSPMLVGLALTTVVLAFPSAARACADLAVVAFGCHHLVTYGWISAALAADGKWSWLIASVVGFFCCPIFPLLYPVIYSDDFETNPCAFEQRETWKRSSRILGFWLQGLVLIVPWVVSEVRSTSDSSRKATKLTTLQDTPSQSIPSTSAPDDQLPVRKKPSGTTDPTPKPFPSKLAKRLIGKWEQADEGIITFFSNIEFKERSFECGKWKKPSLRGGEDERRAGTYRFVSENRIELVTTFAAEYGSELVSRKGSKCVIDVSFGDGENELVLTVHQGWNSFHGDYQGKFYRTGTLVLRTSFPIIEGAHVWVEVDGKRVAIWDVGTKQVQTKVVAGTHRVTVRSRYRSRESVICERLVDIKPDKATTLDVEPR